MLEEKREDVFTDSAIIVQKFFRGAIARKRFAEMRSNMMVIQTRYRAFKAATEYKQLAEGFSCLQATIKMNKLTTEFRTARSRIQGIQAWAKGKIARDNFKARANSLALIQAVMQSLAAKDIVRKAKDEAEAERIKQEAMAKGISEAEAEQKKQEAMAALEAQDEESRAAAAEKAAAAVEADAEFEKNRDGDFDDGDMVDQMFGGFDDEDADEGGGTDAFGFDADDAPGTEGDDGEFGGFEDSRVQAEDEDDISNYKFTKFASTYFVGNANSYYIRRAIKAPLLATKEQADKQAALSVWVTILRFMGDMPEPRGQKGAAAPAVMSTMYKTLGRKSSSAKIDFSATTPTAEPEPVKEKKSFSKKLASMTLRKKTKMAPQIQAAYEAEEAASQPKLT